MHLRWVSSTKMVTEQIKKLYKIDERNAYTVLHKLGIQYQETFSKSSNIRTKVGTYAVDCPIFTKKDTFKEHVEDPKMFEKEFLKYLEENNIELDDTIAEEVTLDNGKLSKGIYVLTQDVVSTEVEDEIDALAGDEVEAFEDTPFRYYFRSRCISSNSYKNKAEDICFYLKILKK